MLKRFNVTYVKARRAVFEKCTVNQPNRILNQKQVRFEGDRNS